MTLVHSKNLGTCLLIWSMWVGLFPFPAQAEGPRTDLKQQTVVFLGTSLTQDKHPIGVVANLTVAFRVKEGQDYLNVSFASTPGRFSPFTQVSIQEAIKIAARAAGLNPNTWEVFLTFPFQSMTVYGESLSAMVSLVVLAMAKQDPILDSHVLTGKVTPGGGIGAVGGIALKIHAAHARHIQRVIVPEDRFLEDNDWQNPFLMHISPARDLWQAYQMLTGKHLSKSYQDTRQARTGS